MDLAYIYDEEFTLISDLSLSSNHLYLSFESHLRFGNACTVSPCSLYRLFKMKPSIVLTPLSALCALAAPTPVGNKPKFELYGINSSGAEFSPPKFPKISDIDVSRLAHGETGWDIHG